METISVLGLLRKGQVTRFWSAYTLSILGYELVLFAMTIHIYKLTGSVLDVGIFTALNFIPRVLLAPLAGSFVDRYDRRRVFIGCVIGTAALVALISFTRELGLIYLFWFFISTIRVILGPTRVAIMVNIVGQGEFLPVNSLIFGTLSMVRILAPPLGSLLVMVGGIRPVLYLNIVILLGAVLSIMTISLPPVAERQRGPQTASDSLRHAWNGAVYVFRNANLRYLVQVGLFSWRLFTGIQVPLFVVYVQDVLGRDVGDYGIFMMVVGLGSTLGSLVGNRLGRVLSGQQIVGGGMMISYICFALLAATDLFWVACLLVGLSFVTFFAAVVNVHAERDRLTPDKLRGRVYSSVSAMFAPISLISVLAGTALAQWFGIKTLFLGAGLLSVVAFLVITYFSKDGINIGYDQV